jgi:hypothetical protein
MKVVDIVPCIMIEITAGVYQSCPRMSRGVYVLSP